MIKISRVVAAHANSRGRGGVQGHFLNFQICLRILKADFLDPPPLEVRSNKLTLVRVSVRPEDFQKIGSLNCSDFWHDDKSIVYSKK